MIWIDYEEKQEEQALALPDTCKASDTSSARSHDDTPVCSESTRRSARGCALTDRALRRRLGQLSCDSSCRIYRKRLARVWTRKGRWFLL